MPKISWLPSFETGIPEIDNDHRDLVKTCQKMEAHHRANKNDSASCMAYLSDLQEQAADHFKREEAFLTSIDFPHLKSHTSTHNQLLELVQKT